jgi:hypothetical protein
MELHYGHFECGSDSIFGFIITITIMMLGIIAVECCLMEKSYSRPITRHNRSPSEMGANYWKHIKVGPD